MNQCQAKTESLPFVSVIIPTFNDVRRLLKCLSGLKWQSYPRDRFEIIVVDNGSQLPISQALYPFPWVRLLNEPKPGSYAARNRGIQEARGTILAFTDADCLPEPQWIEKGVERLLSDPATSIVGGQIALYFRDHRYPNMVELYDAVFHGFDQRTTIEKLHFAATANLFTRRSVIEAIGPFDTQFLSGGDAEWCRRAIRRGHRAAFAPKAVVTHPARTSFHQMKQKLSRVVGGQYRLERRGMQPKRAPLRNLLRLTLTPMPLRTTYFLLFRAKKIRRIRWRFGVLLLNTVLRYVEAWEWCRLYLGWQPRRGG